ncbi:hypothetical protein Mfla_0328 [Methylobacillus flagellatus KT]|uniref:Uncharacterized protein n=1 Tax=Methylobacillus flagellatus (strain ATCC 51484 / DSM 6875 / VKM B-1610 / KT) TaxID=265072 RepID=Q1H4I8_METFK|nr:hypothetical protein Mfla_0328 [Methylobacillus flagellatus KT]
MQTVWLSAFRTPLSLVFHIRADALLQSSARVARYCRDAAGTMVAAIGCRCSIRHQQLLCQGEIIFKTYCYVRDFMKFKDFC